MCCRPAARASSASRCPTWDAIQAYVGIVSRCEGAAIHAHWMRGRGPEYATHLSARLYAGYAIPAAYHIEALSACGPTLRAFAAEAFDKADVIVTPTIPTNLPTLAKADADDGPPGTERRFMAVSVNTRPFNYLGLPAISLPCGRDPNGLQIAGRPFAEARVMAVADAYQRDRDWHARKPAI